eukprot:8858570-Heterocapsa_arctica.AAC.1
MTSMCIPSAKPTAAQCQATKIIDEYIEHCCREDSQIEDIDWAKELKKVELTYGGEEVRTPQMLTF